MQNIWEKKQIIKQIRTRLLHLDITFTPEVEILSEGETGHYPVPNQF